MGQLVDGVWRDEWYDTRATGGRFERPQTRFRSWITPDGEPGPDGREVLPAEPGRYHLTVSYACPWAHRTLLVRALRGLQEVIGLSVVHWRMLENGWTFEDGPGVIPHPLKVRYLHEVYTAADPACSGRVTVPVLFDLKTNRIVNNESAEIVRIFDSSFERYAKRPGSLRPSGLEGEIDALNERIYATLNNGVYRAGFATTQAAYEEAIGPLFETLDHLEDRLSRSRYLFGDTLTETDIRLFPTLIRFDLVYVGHFKCNLKRLRDYPNLWGYMLDLFQKPEVRGTVDLGHAKRHYYESHRTINPTGIVPLGPILDLDAPHGRDRTYPAA